MCPQVRQKPGQVWHFVRAWLGVKYEATLQDLFKICSIGKQAWDLTDYSASASYFQLNIFSSRQVKENQGHVVSLSVIDIFSWARSGHLNFQVAGKSVAVT